MTVFAGLFIFLTLAGGATAAAVPVNTTVPPGLTARDVEFGPCKRYTLVFARGSLETGNLGYFVGPPLCDGMKSDYGSQNVACQGIGSPYNALIQDNFLPKGTTDAAIGEATRLITMARNKCPFTKIIASGYSQGASVMHGSLTPMSPMVKSHVFGAITFGDPRNVADNGMIPNYPRNQTRIFCRSGDLICEGIMEITNAHLDAPHDIDAALSFIRQMLS